MATGVLNRISSNRCTHTPGKILTPRRRQANSLVRFPENCSRRLEGAGSPGQFRLVTSAATVIIEPLWRIRFARVLDLASEQNGEVPHKRTGAGFLSRPRTITNLLRLYLRRKNRRPPRPNPRSAMLAGSGTISMYCIWKLLAVSFGPVEPPPR
jgi:hypothetical protein